MKTIEIEKANSPLSEYAGEAIKEPLIIVTKGKPMAAIVPLENADLETVSLSTNPDFIALIERSRTRQKDEGGIKSDDMRSRLGIE